MKKGPLNISEKFYIEQKWNNESIEGLAKTLNRAQSLIEKHIEYCKKKGIGIKLDRQTEAKEKNQPETFNVASQFASKKGATVMTENASTLADNLKKSNRNQNPRPACITQIRDNK